MNNKVYHVILFEIHFLEIKMESSKQLHDWILGLTIAILVLLIMWIISVCVKYYRIKDLMSMVPVNATLSDAV